MKTVQFIFAIALVWALLPTRALAGGTVPQSKPTLLERVADKYEDWRKQIEESNYDCEDDIFRDYIVKMRSVSEAELSYSELLQLIKVINSRHDRGLSETPISRLAYVKRLREIPPGGRELHELETESPLEKKELPVDVERHTGEKEKVNRLAELMEAIERAKKREAAEAAALPIPVCKKRVSPRLWSSRDFIRAEDNPVNPEEEEIDLNVKADDWGHLKDAMELIASTEVGAQVLKAFLPKFERDEINIGEFTEKIRKRYAQQPNAAAIYVYQDVPSLPRYRKIFMQKNTEVGVLAPILLHEIVHSLDKRYHRDLGVVFDKKQEFAKAGKALLPELAKRLNKSVEELTESDISPDDVRRLTKLHADYRREADLTSFRAERIAYGIQQRFIEELTQDLPCYKKYVEVHGRKGHLIARPMSHDQIIHGYGLDRSTLEDAGVFKVKLEDLLDEFLRSIDGELSETRDSKREHR